MSPPHVVVANTNCRILMSPPPVEVASHLLWLVYMGCCVHAPEGPHSVHGLSWPRARKVPSCTWAVVSTRLEGSLVYMGSRGYAPKMIRAIFWRASPFPPTSWAGAIRFETHAVGSVASPNLRTKSSVVLPDLSFAMRETKKLAHHGFGPPSCGLVATSSHYSLFASLNFSCRVSGDAAQAQFVASPASYPGNIRGHVAILWRPTLLQSQPYLPQRNAMES